ncbi:hypothetical protein DNTS_032771 [Danionella cerebrum]|uniref:DNA repair protein REV1 n=1 Tax=Danionella cerebrum TaxID=2873325 RepID=A0A553RA59_9TELE|nr:hypothetical protein DNTS_032771 [Danionella translucida]
MSRDGWRKKASEDDGWGGRGGYMAAKISKLEKQFKIEAPREQKKGGTSSSIFSGVAIHVNGYTDPSADELRRLMMLHGGQFHLYYTRSKTTHIIASNLPNSKIQELRGEKVVRPEWITDSVSARGGQDPSTSHGATKPELIHPQSDINQNLSKEPTNFTEQNNPPLDVRLRNGLHNIISKKVGERLNGIHDEDDTSSLLLRPSRDPLLSNGFVHPVNGALKPQNWDTEPYQPSCSHMVREANDHQENDQLVQMYRHPKTTSSPGPSALHQKSHLQDQARVRRNGSYHTCSNSSTVTSFNNSSGRSSNEAGDGAEAGIISEFFSHSRLHHISTWRNEFSEYVNTLQSRRRAVGGAVFSGKEKLKKLKAKFQSATLMAAPQVRQTCILHVDMDCFFVSVGIRHRPDLIGKAVAVTSNRGPGLVSHRAGANPQLEFQYYQNKQKQYRKEKTEESDLGITPSPQDGEVLVNGEDAGVRNGMFFGRAKQLCPDVQPVPYDFQAYKEVALTMYETLSSYTHNIEALSCDEALVDATGLLVELGITPDELARSIREDIKGKTGCSASVGMGPNILLARMATRRAKPNGQYLLRSEEVDDFIRDQPVSTLPGVGRSMSSRLTALAVSTCGDLQQLSMSRLQREFGPRTGQTLFRFCRGLDDRAVRSEKERKSVSAEMNYNIRFTKVEEAEQFLTNLSMEVQKRLEGAGLRGRRVTLKIMMRKPGAPVEPAKYGGHGICDNFSKSVLLPQATDSGQVISAEVIKLFHVMKLNVKDMRGVGLQVQQLEGSHAEPAGPCSSRGRSIRDLLQAKQPTHSPKKQPGVEPRKRRSNLDQTHLLNDFKTLSSSSQEHVSPPSSPPPPTISDPVPGTSQGGLQLPQTANTVRRRLNVSIEVPSPSQVDPSVLDSLPLDIRRQVEETWKSRDEQPSTSLPFLNSPHRHSSPSPGPSLVLQLPHQPGQPCTTDIILELPDFSEVDPDVFAALPRELQEELRSAYKNKSNAQMQATAVLEPKPLFPSLKQPPLGKIKRRYKKKNLSPAKKGPSPLKKQFSGQSPSKIVPLPLKTESTECSSSASIDVPKMLSTANPRPITTLGGAFEFSEIRTLLREWVTSVPEPMEEDILQVLKFCTQLVEDKDLEKLDLVIKCMKRLMQQSSESVWSMAFDFILDNVQEVIQQSYGSTLKIT